MFVDRHFCENGENFRQIRKYMNAERIRNPFIINFIFVIFMLLCFAIQSDEQSLQSICNIRRVGHAMPRYDSPDQSKVFIKIVAAF